MFDSYPFTAQDADSDRWRRLTQWLALNLPSDMDFSLGQTRPDPSQGHDPNVPRYNVTFTRPGYPSQEVDAGLLLRGPAITITHLQVAFSFGDPTHPVFFDYVREQPTAAPRPTPLPAQPEGIGAETAPGSGVWFALPGDLRPAGAVVVVGGVSYQKRIRLDPFGVHPYYVKI